MFLRFSRTTTLILAAFAALPAGATTIVIRSGTDNGNYLTGTCDVSWTQTGTFSGVTIQANLFSRGGTATGNAYVTTQLGPGTTPAQQIATAPISVTNTAPAPVTVFSGLTLGPGTYYVTIQDLNTLSWQAYSTAISTTVGPGVTANNDGQIFGAVPPYPPSGTFSNKGQNIIYSATGTVGGAASVPVLSGWAMLGTALLLLSSGLWLIKLYRPQE